MRRLFLLLFLLISHGVLFAQSYSSVQYNTNDGLASSTVYCMIQDKDGFMWFGTGGGLCRFDGTHFKTFTTVDGLPDNEVLKLHQDSKGRIWMLPFKNAICYYFNGRIYNQQNDSLLKKIHMRERLLNLFEDSEGTIWTNELDAIYKIYKNDRVERLQELGEVKLKGVLYFGNDVYDRIWFSIDTGDERILYRNENGKSSFIDKISDQWSPNDFLSSGTITIWRKFISKYAIRSDRYPHQKLLVPKHTVYVNTFSIINDSIISLNFSTAGTTLYNIKNCQLGASLIDGKSVSSVLQDREKSWWIATLGEGVFRVPSENFRNLDVPGMRLPGNQISLLTRLGSVLYITAPRSPLTRIGLPHMNAWQTKILPEYNHKIFDLIREGNKYVLISGNGVFRVDTTFRLITEYRPSIFPKNVVKRGRMLVIATNKNVVKFDIDNFRITDTVWEGRSTDVHVQNGTIYVGTLHGLYALTENKPVVYLGTLDTAFQNRISTLSESADGSLWVGTTNDGLLRFRDGKVLQRYTTANGLSSNICRTVLIDGNILWLGTDKGLNKIDIRPQPEKIIQVTKGDGLSSDEIIKLVTYRDTLFVCTSGGITYFNKNRLDQFSECILHVLDVSGDSQNLPDSQPYTVTNKYFKISYVGISFKSAGDIVYKYRLCGTDTAWKTTRETTLEFVSLPYGQYNLELVAENKFGVQSNTVVIKLEVPIPFWKTPAFYVLSVLLFIALVILIYKTRLNMIKRREKEKTKLNKELADMEMKALRAQMNPHFIFNVLNSIHYYIGYNNSAAAQNYLAKFSKLIRLTLDHSKNTFITLDEEQRLLKLYLDLEKMRLENRFVYEITVDNSIDGNTLIPNMLLQPFVENAIKHGFRKEIKDPKVSISIQNHGDAIHCIITDNGIGRAKSQKHPLENDHQPAGLAMVIDKTEVLRYHYNYHVIVEISDLNDNENKSCGTQIFIKFPKLTEMP